MLSDLVGDHFPLAWKMTAQQQNSHAQFLLQNCVTCAGFILIAFYCHSVKFYLAV